VSWFVARRGRLEYRGRITRQPFGEWCATREGTDTIARVAAGMRFSLFGRTRSARRRLWRELDAASRTDAFVSAVAAEPPQFERALAAACYADALPRVHVALGRLVLVPRVLVNYRAGVSARLMHAPVLAGVDEAVRTFLLDRIVIELDAALAHASPVPRRPVLAADGWACIGVRLDTMWGDPIWAGQNAAGHLFMYELPARRLARREYKALAAGIEQLSATVSTLSRTARDATLRAATLRRV